MASYSEAIIAMNDYINKSKNKGLVEEKKYKKEEKNVVKKLDVSKNLKYIDEKDNLIKYFEMLKKYIETMNSNRKEYEKKYGESSSLIPILTSYSCTRPPTTLDEFVKKSVRGCFSSWKGLRKTLMKVNEAVNKRLEIIEEILEKSKDYETVITSSQETAEKFVREICRSASYSGLIKDTSKDDYDEFSREIINTIIKIESNIDKLPMKKRKSLLNKYKKNRSSILKLIKVAQNNEEKKASEKISLELCNALIGNDN